VEDFSKLVSQARNDWTALPTNTVHNPGLADYAEWLKENVSLRFVMAHSTAWNTTFQPSSVKDLEQVVGPYRHWIRQGNQWIPTWTGSEGDANFWFYRSLSMNGKLTDTSPSLMIHGGCEVNTPDDGGATRPYTKYGGGQNAESILFYAKILAIMTRAKLFYDQPKGWQDYFRNNQDAVFGDIWYRYYLTDSANPKLWQEDFSAVKRA